MPDDRPQFNFMRSYLDSLSGFDDDTAGKCILALAKYALNNELPDLSDPVLRMYFSLIRPIVDLGRTRANARRKKDDPDPEDPDDRPINIEQAAGPDDDDNGPVEEVLEQSKNKTKTKRKQIKKKAELSSGFAFLKDKEKEKDKDKDKDVFISARARGYTNASKAVMNLKMDEVIAYARKKGYEFQPGDYNRFMQYNSARGWKIGSTPVEDWRPLVDLWITPKLKATDGPLPDYPARDSDCQKLAHDLDRALFDLPLKAAGGA